MDSSLNLDLLYIKSQLLTYLVWRLTNPVGSEVGIFKCFVVGNKWSGWFTPNLSFNFEYLWPLR